MGSASYAVLLEKTRTPQPQLQKLAVVAVFEKYRSEPPSDAGRDAICRCLRSNSSAVADQSAREFCRLVRDSKLDIHSALLELQSALDDAPNNQLATLFIKAIGLLTRLGVQENPDSFRFHSSENHPFVKILSFGAGAHGELVKQVTLWILKCSYLGVEAVSEFLRPFLNYSVIKAPDSSSNSTFLMSLVNAIAAYCCSFPLKAIYLLKILTSSLKCMQCTNAEEAANVCYVFECLADSYLVVLRHLAGMGLHLVDEAQLGSLALLQVVLSQYGDFQCVSGAVEKILYVSRHLLAMQKSLGLKYVSELSSLMMSLFHILIQAELEHEQHSLLDLVLLIVRWKSECECRIESSISDLKEELLFIFPMLALISSPSKSLKQSASDLLSVLERSATNMQFAQWEKQELKLKQFLITTPGCLVCRFLSNLWFQDRLPSNSTFYVDYFSASDGNGELKQWASSVRDYVSGIVKTSHFSTFFSRSEEISMIICSVASVLLLHQTKSSAIDLLAMYNRIAPSFGIPMLLIILYYNYISSSEGNYQWSSDFGIELLSVLPSTASHHAMLPLLLQILRPMLHNDADTVIKSTGIRLLCKTWEINDHVFETLQRMLEPETIMHAAERDIAVCIAFSIRDVCKRNPDKGVDIILSISACIENDDPLIQSLGLQGLAHLCEADVIDFYTAWDVIEKCMQNYSKNATVAHSFCLLLRWGAMDVDAYPEAASRVLNILWDVGTHREYSQSSLWKKSRSAAFTALLQYEVLSLQRSISSFSSRNFEFLISGLDADPMEVMEEFQARIITTEHITRRRYVKEKVASGFRSKIYKLLDVVPGVVFRSVAGNIHKTREISSADFFFPPHKDVNKNRIPLKGINRDYEDTIVELASSLQLSRNIILALFCVQSWEVLMEGWMRSCIIKFEERASSLDRSLQAAKDILKTIMRLAEEANPRSAENIALAIGAFCLVLPTSAHAVKSIAAKFLLGWLYQHEHEQRQWPAAISLGLISSCLHVTDHELKMRIINALIEVSMKSKSGLLEGACGIGLGFSCQDLLTSIGSTTQSLSEKDVYRLLETQVLRKIVWNLVYMICRFGKTTSSILEKLETLFPKGDIDSSDEACLQMKNMDLVEDGFWGIAGPIIGLGNSFGALYRAGAHDVVLYLKNLIISWIPTKNIILSNPTVEESFLAMSALGACLAVPTIFSFCRNAELHDDIELDPVMKGLVWFISELLSIKGLDAFHQSLLMASCAGAGSIFFDSLNLGLPLEAEYAKHLLSLFRRTYSSPHPLIVLGGMSGVVNALGAGAGTMIPSFSLHSFQKTPQQELANFFGPLPPNHALETDLTSLIQEMFLLAQNCVDSEVQDKAAWAICFLRHYLFSRIHNEETAESNLSGGNQPAPQGVAADSLVMKISSWIMKVIYSESWANIDIRTLDLCIRCLSHAPRLPHMDWRTLISQCMKYGGQVTEMPSQHGPLKRTLREDCFLFLLSHASKLDPLMSFLDELYEFARFKSLESNLQSLMLLHLADLFGKFSNARLVKLFDDMTYFLHILSSDQQNLVEHSLRVSFWKGLELCISRDELETRDYLNYLERCMEILFTTSQWPLYAAVESYQKHSNLEWCKAIKCLGKARLGWLLDLLLLPIADLVEQNSQSHLFLKKLSAKIELVRVGAIPVLELSKFKSYILNINSEVIWSILVELSVTLRKLDEGVRRQWIVDTAEILCVTSYPSTALRFLGLLSGLCCKYMPILVADKLCVLADLPVTLSSLLETSGWGTIREPVALHVWKSTERIHNWAKHVQHDANSPAPQGIHESESTVSALLCQVLHQTCVSLKRYLPASELLKLSNMVI